jgi:hypothetical protein
LKVSLREGFDYIPEWNDNKKEKEPIKVFLRFQTGLDMTDLIGMDGKIDKMKDWLTICKSVENLFDDEGNKLGPEDIATNGALAGLYLELKGAYRSESVVNKKK